MPGLNMKTTKEIIAQYKELPGEDLIPLLQEIQSEQGYISNEAIRAVASALDMPSSRVYGTATFYNQFRFAPLGKYVIQICRGTACHVKGSLKLVDHLKRKLKINQLGNSPDGRYTLETVACIGACSIAPAICLNGEFYGHMDTDKMDRLLEELD